MTVPNEKTKKNHDGTGAVVTFGYDFLILDESHMKVYVDDVLKESDYSVTGVGVAEGGEVTFGTAPAAGTVVTLLRFVPYTQLTDYIDYDRFGANTHERALDMVVMACAQLQEQLDRTMTAALSADPDLSFLLPAREAGKALMWDDTEKKISNSNDLINGLLAACQLAQSLAETAQSFSEAARDSSLTYSLNAEGHMNDAEEWASRDDGNPAKGVDYSSKEWAIGNPGAESSAKTLHAATQVLKDATQVLHDAVMNFPNTTNSWGAPQRYVTNEELGVTGTITVNAENQPYTLLRITGNVTITVEGFTGGDSTLWLDLDNSSGASRTITFSGVDVWPDGLSNTLVIPNGRFFSVVVRRSIGQHRGSIVWEGDRM